MIPTAKSITSADLRRLILSEKSRLVVLFSGNWCPDCRDFKPIWDRWAATASEATFTLEVPRGGDEWKDWDLEEIPTVISFGSGRELRRVHGTISQENLEELTRQSRGN